MVPGKFISLLPPEITKPRVSAGGPKPAVAVPYSAVPKFAKPDILIPDNFWSNLKQFLTERPVKVRERQDAPFTQTSLRKCLCDTIADFFRSSRASKRPVNSRLAGAWGSNFGGFGTRIKEFFSPPRQAPLPFAVKPIKVKDIWSKDENFGTSQALAVFAHVAAIGLLFVPIFFTSVSTPIEAKNKLVNVTPLDISPYVSQLPPGNDKTGPGGGAFRGGVNGVGNPTCFYTATPEYSDEARKTKYQGAVVVEGIINLDGRVTNIKVVKGVGLGLDENAVAAVKTWRCRPAIGPSGKPVPTLVPIEVTFRLYYSRSN